MRYEWKGGRAPAGLKPDIVAHELLSIQQSSGLTASSVVDAARPKDAPLHPAFEWNNKVAAEKYREEQARHLIRCVSVVYDEPANREPKTVRAFVHLERSDEAAPSYVDTESALANPMTRNFVLQRAKGELEQWRRRYEHLNEFADVVAAIKAAA